MQADDVMGVDAIGFDNIDFDKLKVERAERTFDVLKVCENSSQTHV